VDILGQRDYADLVEQARDFLMGKSQEIQKKIADNMQKASDALEFEKAAQLRDRIGAMSSIQAHQNIHAKTVIEADIIGLYHVGEQTCIQVFFFRGGCNYGNRAYYPSHPPDADPGQILEAFIGQFYANKMPPKLLLLSQGVPQKELLIQALSDKAESKVQVEVPRRGEKRRIISLAIENARKALGRKIAENTSQHKLLDGLVKIFDLISRPERIEIYDNSHISGTNSVGGMVVVGSEGFIKNAYRKFNIRTVLPNAELGNPKAGDDYAMMREVLTRRFSRILNENPDRSSGQWPDLILIDGGAGHLSTTLGVLENLGINGVAVAAIAKGPNRNAGEERFFLPDRLPFSLDSRDPVLYFLQRLRDEAHRFAIGAHRTRRGKGIEHSPLDEIQGVGGIRKKSLLHHFGSARAVSEAGTEDLELVDGISRAMAVKIYDWFHPED
jgi:excinuclease ABC subunit C